MPEETPTVDLTPVLDILEANAPVILGGVVGVMGLAASVALIIWAWPKFLGLFKRTAK